LLPPFIGPQLSSPLLFVANATAKGQADAYAKGQADAFAKAQADAYAKGYADATAKAQTLNATK
jgi:flagellar biosynthesis/type III secretory pathway protein FliH